MIAGPSPVHLSLQSIAFFFRNQYVISFSAFAVFEKLERPKGIPARRPPTT
jgi:hypothetical protein